MDGADAVSSQLRWTAPCERVLKVPSEPNQMTAIWRMGQHSRAQLSLDDAEVPRELQEK
jgi:hypothetical protein